MHVDRFSEMNVARKQVIVSFVRHTSLQSGIVLTLLTYVTLVAHLAQGLPVLNAETTKKLLDKSYQNLHGYFPRPAAPSHFDDQDTSNHVYGEITFDGVEKMLKLFPIGPNDVVYDLGSGVGKFVAQVYLRTTAKRVVGIELAKNRHERAVIAKERIKKMRPDLYLDQMQFIEANFLEMDIKDATFIYIANTMFSVEFMDNICKVLTELPNKVRLVLLKPFSKKCGRYRKISEQLFQVSWLKRGDRAVIYQKPPRLVKRADSQ